jgi:hypothetical protein
MYSYSWASVHLPLHRRRAAGHDRDLAPITAAVANPDPALKRLEPAIIPTASRPGSVGGPAAAADSREFGRRLGLKALDFSSPAFRVGKSTTLKGQRRRMIMMDRLSRTRNPRKCRQRLPILLPGHKFSSAKLTVPANHWHVWGYRAGQRPQ